MINKLNILFFLILIFAILSDLLIPFLIGIKYPGYNHLIQTISSLGTSISPVQKYQCINLIFVGILFVSFALGQFFLFNSKT